MGWATPCGSQQLMPAGSIFETHVRWRVPYILYVLHTVLVIEIVINCAPYLTLCELCLDGYFSFLPCVHPPLRHSCSLSRLWVLPNSCAAAVLPHRPHHSLAAQGRRPGELLILIYCHPAYSAFLAAVHCPSCMSRPSDVDSAKQSICFAESGPQIRYPLPFQLTSYRTTDKKVEA